MQQVYCTCNRYDWVILTPRYPTLEAFVPLLASVALLHQNAGLKRLPGSRLENVISTSVDEYSHFVSGFRPYYLVYLDESGCYKEWASVKQGPHCWSYDVKLIDVKELYGIEWECLSLPLDRGISTTLYTSKSTLSEGPMAAAHVCAVGKYPQEPYQVVVAWILEIEALTIRQMVSYFNTHLRRLIPSWPTILDTTIRLETGFTVYTIRSFLGPCLPTPIIWANASWWHDAKCTSHFQPSTNGVKMWSFRISGRLGQI
jgi:hypothetical protein